MFSNAPYHDDYTPESGFKRVLFKPNKAVQARELNQVQSIFNNELTALSNHIFKNGSKVSNCRTGIFKRDYVRLMPLTVAGEPLTRPVGNAIRLVGVVSGVEASLANFESATTNGDPDTAYVIYTRTGVTSTGVVSEQKTFIHGEDINVFNDEGLQIYTWTVRCPTCAGSTLSPEVSPTGKGYFFSIDEGIIYYNGMYISVLPQELIITKYVEVNADGYDISNDEMKIGLDFVDSIVTAFDDVSLFDNSAGTPNSGAEGADRYKVELKLARRTYNAEDGDNFILLAKIAKNYNITYTKTDAEYSEIMKEMSRRTYEQAGNFSVAPYTCTFYESHKKDVNDVEGWSPNGNKDKLVVAVEQGIAYVAGVRVSGDGVIAIEFDKARDTRKKVDYSTFIPFQQYTTVNVVSSNYLVNQNNDGNVASLIDVVLYDNTVNVSGVSAGTQIGVAQVVDQYFFSEGTTQLVFSRVTITDPNKTFADVKGIKKTDNTFVGNTVLVSGSAVLHNSNKKSLIVPIQQNNIKSVRSAVDSNVGATKITVRRKLYGTTNASGVIQWTVSSNEAFAGFNSSSDVCIIDGTRFSLEPQHINVNDNQLTLSVGGGNANKTIVFLTNVDTTEQTEKVKTFSTHTFTTAVVPTGALNAVTMLGKADALQLLSVRIVNPSDVNFTPVDVTSEYTLNNGQTAFYYTESSITRNIVRSSFSSDHRLEISFSYFVHTGTAPMFTIDSYAEAINDELIDYATLPKITVDGIEYKVSDVFDYRPLIVAGSIVSNAKLPALGTTTVFDIEYYIPRVDIVQLNKDGVITVKQGVPSESPVPPSPDIDNMLLYIVKMNAYVYSLMDVLTSFIDNKRYTMKDINSIETRLTNLEYYTTLTMLEQKTLDTPVYDDIGITRFKNGFLVDSFTDFSACDITSPNFKCAYDRIRGEMRPKFTSFNVPFVYAPLKSTNVQLLGNVAMLPFDEVEFMSNDFATKTISINPYLVYNKQGSVLLSPNIDTWADDTQLPTIIANADAGVDALRKVANSNDLLGTDWASWVDLNTTSQRSSTTQVVGNDNVTTTVINTSKDQTRTGTQTTLESRTDTYSVEDVVKDVKIMPYIRSKIIDFYCANMKPNTRVYVYFDGVNVTEHTRMKRPVGNDALLARSFTLSGGAPLITDENGELVGEFKIPEKTFFTGEKSFVVKDTLTVSEDISTSASTKYFAGGITQTKQTSTLNVISPVFKTSTVNDVKSVSTSTREVTVTPIPTPPAVVVPQEKKVFQTPVEFITPPIRTNLWWSSTSVGSIFNRVSRDPVAQSFEVDESCFISRLSLYFSSVDMKTSDNVWVEIRTVVNGYPSTEVLSRKDYNPTQLANGVSSDSTTPFDVVFDIPVYVESGRTYCFVVGGHSPDTKLWVSRLGEEVVNIKGKIVEEPPTIHTSFRSLNGSTWTAEQFEFIKHKLFRCEFKTDTMTITVQSQFSDYVKLGNNPIEVQPASNRVRIYIDNHGLSVNDKFNVSLYEGQSVDIEVANNTPPQIGQRITTVSGSATIKNITGLATLNMYNVTLENVVGDIILNEEFLGSPLVKQFDTFVLVSNNNSSKTNVQVTECNGFVRSDIKASLGFSTISSVNVAEFNREYQVVEVDSADSVIVEMIGSFQTAGKFGFNFVHCYNVSRKFDTLNVACEHMVYNSQHVVTLNTVDMDYNLSPLVNINLNGDTNMTSPRKVATSVNEVTVFGTARKSVELTIVSTSNNHLISPVYNLSSISGSAVSNRVDTSTPAQYNVAPNAASRYVAETSPAAGSSVYKNITAPVVLNNAADNLRIYVDVYRETNADFDIYVRTRGSETELLEDMTWLKLTGYDKTKYSSGIDDMIEYTVDSEKSAGWLAREFTEFQVKIVGSSSNSAKPPIFKRLRVIAVT